MNFRSSVSMLAHASHQHGQISFAGPDLLAEARIAAGEACEGVAPLGHCVAIRSEREDGVALELGQREWRHEPAHDPVQETGEDRVRVRNCSVRECIVAMRKGDRLEECGVPADVGENEWPARRSRGAGACLGVEGHDRTLLRELHRQGGHRARARREPCLRARGERRPRPSCPRAFDDALDLRPLGRRVVGAPPLMSPRSTRPPSCPAPSRSSRSGLAHERTTHGRNAPGMNRTCARGLGNGTFLNQPGAGAPADPAPPAPAGPITRVPVSEDATPAPQLLPTQEPLQHTRAARGPVSGSSGEC